MSITGRLTSYFLAALGGVLIAFSAFLYVLSARHLHGLMDRRLEAALHVLTAAIEVHPDDVEWEPLERAIPLGQDADPTHVRWSLQDERGNLIDGSRNLTASEPAGPIFAAETWRVLACRVEAGRFEPTPLPHYRPGQETARAAAGLPADRTALRRAFVLTVGLSELPDRALLGNLAAALTAVSAAIGLAAGVGGRLLCRQALDPLTRMADRARALRADPEDCGLLTVPNGNDELTDLGHAFNALLTSMRGALARQAGFAGAASHQLRTPLAALLAAVDVSLRRPREPEEYRRILGVVQRRGRELQQLVEALLALTRGPAEMPAAEREVLRLDAWCRERWAACGECERRGAPTITMPDEPVHVLGPGILVAQILDNLLDNARKYGSTDTAIAVRLEVADGMAVLSVTDSGCGLTAEECDRVFEPFFRSESARRLGIPGTGLGLSIARQMAQELGGRLEVESRPGCGSTFRLLLPRVAAIEVPVDGHSAASSFG